VDAQGQRQDGERSLSKEQFEWLAEAIAQWRQLQATLKEMQRLSRQVLFETMPTSTS